jgi:hypothetical protein
MRAGSLVLALHNLDLSGANQVLVNIIADQLRESNVVILSPKNGPAANRFFEAGACIRIGGIKEQLHLIRDVILVVCNTIMTADIVCWLERQPMPCVWILHEFWSEAQIAEQIKMRPHVAHINVGVVKRALQVASTAVFVCDAQKRLYHDMMRGLPVAPSAVIYVGVPAPAPAGMAASITSSSSTLSSSSSSSSSTAAFPAIAAAPVSSEPLRYKVPRVPSGTASASTSTARVTVGSSSHHMISVHRTDSQEHDVTESHSAAAAAAVAVGGSSGGVDGLFPASSANVSAGANAVTAGETEPEAASALRSLLGMPPHRPSTPSAATDAPTHHTSTATATSAAAAAHGSGQNVFTILLLGVVCPRKNQLWAVEMLEVLYKRLQQQQQHTAAAAAAAAATATAAEAEFIPASTDQTFMVSPASSTAGGIRGSCSSSRTSPMRKKKTKSKTREGAKKKDTAFTPSSSVPMATPAAAAEPLASSSSSCDDDSDEDLLGGSLELLSCTDESCLDFPGALFPPTPTSGQWEGTSPGSQIVLPSSAHTASHLPCPPVLLDSSEAGLDASHMPPSVQQPPRNAIPLSPPLSSSLSSSVAPAAAAAAAAFIEDNENGGIKSVHLKLLIVGARRERPYEAAYVLCYTAVLLPFLVCDDVSVSFVHLLMPACILCHDMTPNHHPLPPSINHQSTQYSQYLLPYRYVQQVEAAAARLNALVSAGTYRYRPNSSIAAVSADAPSSPAVEIYPVTDDVEQYFAQADCLLLPSTNEVTPLVMVEAMARGVPVLCTKVGGIAELMTHGIEGFHFSVEPLPPPAEHSTSYMQRVATSAAAAAAIPVATAADDYVDDDDDDDDNNDNDGDDEESMRKRTHRIYNSGDWRQYCGGMSTTTTHHRRSGSGILPLLVKPAAAVVQEERKEETSASPDVNRGGMVRLAMSTVNQHDDSDSSAAFMECTDYLLSLIRSPELCAELGRNGRQKYLSQMQICTMSQRYLSLFRQLSPPVVLVDMDGVLCDWDKGFIHAFNRVFARRRESQGVLWPAPPATSAAEDGGDDDDDDDDDDDVYLCRFEPPSSLCGLIPTGHSPDAPPPIPDRSRHYEMSLCLPEEYRPLATALFHAPGFFASLPPKEGAVSAVEHMATRYGMEVLLCSAPVLSSHFCAQEKIEVSTLTLVLTHSLTHSLACLQTLTLSSLYFFYLSL